MSHNVGKCNIKMSYMYSWEGVIVRCVVISSILFWVKCVVHNPHDYLKFDKFSQRDVEDFTRLLFNPE